MAELGERYYIDKNKMEPAVFLGLTDNWISLNIRYIVLAKERRPVKNRIYTRML